LSRSPQPALSFLCMSGLNRYDVDTEEAFLATAEVAIAEISDHASISLDDIRRESDADDELKLLSTTIQSGFPGTQHLTDCAIRQYFNVKDQLWLQDGLVMLKDRVVIPKSLRCAVLKLLHSAHQGVEGMRARATKSVYWPGINSSIRSTRANCKVCNEIAPSQAREALQSIPQPQFPFQHVCMDGFEFNNRHYLVLVDRFSGWLIIFHTKTYPTSNHIINSLRSTFSVYGVPERLFTDGGLPFQSTEFNEFLKRWKISRMTSSARYPQSNGRAELAVKTTKRLLQQNTASDGSLNCEKACRALLQYRNTPIQHIGLSPTQLLFHRALRDSLPTDPRNLRPSKLWLEAAENREKALEKRNLDMSLRYNSNTRPLSVLPAGTKVLVQDVERKGRWNRSGIVVDADDRKYFIRMDGSSRVISRNRRHIKPVFSESDTPPRNEEISIPNQVRVPRMLRNLLPYNRPGSKDF
ncbi:MAG: integrase, partial [Bacteroidota bacterium]